MTIERLMNRVDEMHANDWSPELKLSWLSEIEHQVKIEVFDTHVMPEADAARAAAFNGYDEKTPKDMVLLAPEPFSALYQYYLEAQIARADGESSQQKDATTLFDNMYLTYKRYVNRMCAPINKTGAFKI